MAYSGLEFALPNIQGRLRQGWLALRPKPEPLEATFTRGWLNDAQRPLFDRLPAHDRRHLTDVARALERESPENPDLIVAGLLHDIGKSDGASRVRLMDRVVNVVVGSVSPRALQWMARPGDTRWRSGIQLAVHHPELGAALAERAGCSDRTVWLIKHHERVDLHDSDLQRLIAIDRATP